MHRVISFSTAAVLLTNAVGAAEVRVDDLAELRRAVATAKAGTVILIGPGRYPGGLFIGDLRGEADHPIILSAADPQIPPVFEGGGAGFHLSRVSYVELRGLVVSGAEGNGINIDDGGSAETPSRHVVLEQIVVRDVGPESNRDGIKLSGVQDFRVAECTVERWGDRGSGIDMVGCRDGVVVGCTFRHDEGKGDNGVQTKGGSRDIVVRRCRFEHAGQRAVNIGGSTGRAFFRPRPEGFEAMNIRVEDCTFVGSLTPVAFVGADGATVEHNTIYRPRRWGFRVLQETHDPDFMPCRNGRIIDNVIAFRSDEMTVPVNVGPGTAIDTFTLARNVWYCLDAPERSRPRLPVTETAGLYGIDPGFANAERGDLRINPKSAAFRAGVRPQKVEDRNYRPAIGAASDAGCLANPKRVRRLRISEPGVYENILVDGEWSESTLVKIEADGVTLRHCEIRNGKHNGITVAGKNAVIESCKIHHLLAGTFSNQHDAHGITGRPVNLVIRNCNIGLTSGDSIQFDPGRGPWTDVSVENCTLWTAPLDSDAAGFKKGERPGENAIDTKQRASNPRSRLIIKNSLMHGWRQPGQIGNMAALNLKNHVAVRVEHCVFVDNEICLRLRGGDDEYGGANVTVENCALYDSNVGLRAEEQVRDLKIRRLREGGGLQKLLDEAGGGLGPGYEHEAGDAPPPFHEAVQDGLFE